MNADIIIVGAGKVGSALALALQDSGLDLLLLDGGPLKPAPFDPQAEKALLAAIKFLPPSARGPGFPQSHGPAAGPLTTAPPQTGKKESKALF